MEDFNFINEAAFLTLIVNKYYTSYTKNWNMTFDLRAMITENSDMDCNKD